MSAHPPDLERKFSKKLDERKTMQLSPEELDLMVECGAYDAICQAAQEFRKAQCRERSARSRSTSAAPSGFTRERGGTTKSSGMTKTQDASEALARAQQMLTKQG